MDDDEALTQEFLARRFEEQRARLRAVAYRMLGSLSEADDAVQEAWLRLSRSDAGDVHNLAGWLTTVVGRVCLDMLRSRASRSEESLDMRMPDPIVSSESGVDPEHEALLADSVGLALLVVLETLAPAERLAFVLHDLFAVPFEEIAPIVGRTPTAARQLASRARRRVQGSSAGQEADQSQHREIVEAFMAAARGGDFDALLALLDPDVTLRADAGVLMPRADRGPVTATRIVSGAREAGARQRPAGHRDPGARSAGVGHELHRPGGQDRRDRHPRRPGSPGADRPGVPQRLSQPASITAGDGFTTPPQAAGRCAMRRPGLVSAGRVPR
jgi:RNA polymerase sigma factor (sigma-70 family)